MALSRRNRPNRPRVGFLCRQCITCARNFLQPETFHQQSDGIAVDTVASTACPRRCVKPVFLCFELFVYDLDLLGDYFAAESVDRDVDPVTLFALNNETLEARFSRRISSALRYQIKDREE